MINRNLIAVKENNIMQLISTDGTKSDFYSYFLDPFWQTFKVKTYEAEIVIIFIFTLSNYRYTHLLSLYFYN